VVLIIMENHGYGPSGSCRTNDVPYPSTLPTLAPFTFITPNICHDMHSCATSTGDTWLSHHVPHLLAAGAIVIVTFDEGTTSSNRVMTAEVGPSIRAGTRDGTRYSHYGLLGGLEAHFDVRELRNAATANTLPV
jgi:phosphatidylinositol-3-phosphatase